MLRRKSKLSASGKLLGFYEDTVGSSVPKKSRSSHEYDEERELEELVFGKDPFSKSYHLEKEVRLKLGICI